MVLHKIKEFQGEYRWLSNFWTCHIVYNGYTFTSVEAAYQASKCEFSRDFTRFVKLNPATAKRLGRKVTVREDWEAVKLSVMEQLLRLKFDSKNNNHLWKKLIDTHPHILEEGNNWGDVYWGIYKEKGFNHLGKLLMKIRNEFVS